MFNTDDIAENTFESNCYQMMRKIVNHVDII